MPARARSAADSRKSGPRGPSSPSGPLSDPAALEALRARVRVALQGTPGLSEKPMMGSLQFLVRGRIAVGVGPKGVLVRVPVAERARLLYEPGAAAMVLRGREMKRFLRIAPSAVRDEASLRRWVETGRVEAESEPDAAD